MAINYDNKLDEFISTAESHMGEGNSWVCNVTGIPSSYAWCCAFVDACAITANISNKIIYTGSWSCGELASQSVSNGYGTWIDGPWKNANGRPTVGDMVLFRWSSSGYTDDWYCDHIGIVKGYSGGTVTTVEGNKGDSHIVGVRTFSDTYNCVFGYYHPNWATVGVTDISATAYGEGQDIGSGGNSGTGSIFTYTNTREDAVMREVSYWRNKKGKPTLDETNLRCSVINYTTALGTFLAGLVGGYGGSVDASNINDGNIRTCLEYLTSSSCGFNSAAAAGICGNMSRESDDGTTINPAAYNPNDNGSPSGGICQWHLGRLTAMESYVGSNWASNLSGQLDFLMYELRTDFPGLLSTLQSVPNTLEGALQASESFVRIFEQPGGIETEVAKRAEFTTNIWNQLVVTASSTATT